MFRTNIEYDSPHGKTKIRNTNMQSSGIIMILNRCWIVELQNFLEWICQI